MPPNRQIHNCAVLPKQYFPYDKIIPPFPAKIKKNLRGFSEKSGNSRPGFPKPRKKSREKGPRLGPGRAKPKCACGVFGLALCAPRCGACANGYNVCERRTESYPNVWKHSPDLCSFCAEESAKNARIDSQKSCSPKNCPKTRGFPTFSTGLFTFIEENFEIPKTVTILYLFVICPSAAEFSALSPARRGRFASAQIRAYTNVTVCNRPYLAFTGVIVRIWRSRSYRVEYHRNRSYPAFSFVYGRNRPYRFVSRRKRLGVWGAEGNCA